MTYIKKYGSKGSFDLKNKKERSARLLKYIEQRGFKIQTTQQGVQSMTVTLFSVADV